jgi:hypothetical protein
MLKDNKTREYAKMKLLISIMFLISLLGCAFGDREVTLTASGPVVAGDNSLAGLEIALPQFQDTRVKVDMVGKVRNGWGMHTADVLTKSNVADWLTQSVWNQLSHLGCVQKESAPARITGKILVVDCDSMMTLSSQISVYLQISSQGREIFSNNLVTPYSATNWFASSSEFQSALHENLKVWLVASMPGIINALGSLRRNTQTPPKNVVRENTQTPPENVVRENTQTPPEKPKNLDQCPGCGSKRIITGDLNECLSCGKQWQ